MKNNIIIEETLEKEGVYVSTTVGTSMYPMLRNRRDTIIISPCDTKLKKYDIPQNQIIGVMTGFYRGNKRINMDGLAYKTYVRVWYFLFPIRRLLMRAKTFFKRTR